MEDIKTSIEQLARQYAQDLQEKMNSRRLEMQMDDTAHYLIYRVLGITTLEGQAIDLYQNTGRFLYRYAGSFLEVATKFCFQAKFPQAKSHKIPNLSTNSPKTFEIDCLVDNLAYEIKWRDATTDGDHIAKEHARLKAIAQANYIPIRLMYYYPNRSQARRIQEILADLYKANGGFYYHGDSAWEHLRLKTDIDLLAILNQIADTRDHD